jgi:DNA-binding transcriptional regulator YiaG
MMGHENAFRSRLEAVDVADVQAQRKKLGWSQEDLALYLRIPKSHVSGFEQGLRLCPHEIADWLD